MNRWLVAAVIALPTLACGGATPPVIVADGTSEHPTLDASRGVLLQCLGANGGSPCGVMDGTGQWVIAPEYKHATNVGPDMLFAGERLDNALVDVVDLNVTPAAVHATLSQGRPLGTSAGLVAVKLGEEQYALLDRSGMVVAEGLREVRFKSELPRSQGFGPEPFGSYPLPKFTVSDERIAACDREGCGYLDLRGRWVFRAEGDVRPFSEGRAIVGHGDRMVDTEGRTVLENALFASDVSDGHVIAQLDLAEDGEGRLSGNYFVVDRDGNRVSQLGNTIDQGGHHGIFAFSGARAVVWRSDTGRAALVGVDGTFLDAPEGTIALRALFDDRALFATADGVGYVDSTGAVAIPAHLGAPATSYGLSAMDFSEGLAGARATDGDTWGYIDPAGAWAIPPTFDSVQSFDGGYASVYSKGKMQRIDRKGLIIVPKP